MIEPLPSPVRTHRIDRRLFLAGLGAAVVLPRAALAEPIPAPDR